MSSPSKPAHATVNALPGDKGVPKNKSPDGKFLFSTLVPCLMKQEKNGAYSDL